MVEEYYHCEKCGKPFPTWQEAETHEDSCIVKIRIE